MSTFRAILFAAVVSVALWPGRTLAEVVPDDGRAAATLTVRGYGQISRAPDIATVAVTIVTNDERAALALSENNRKFAALSAALGAQGIAAADVNSTSISSYDNPRPPANAPNAANAPFGYVVTRNVRVDVHALATTGRVVDAATAAGATQIDGVSYGFVDRRSVERAALAAAVADAAAQAQTIASAAHVHIVRILRIGDDGGNPVRPGPVAMMSRTVAQDQVPTTIAPSDLDVTSSISITYVIR